MNLRQLLFLKAAVSSEPSERTVVGNPVSFKTKYAEPMKLVIPFAFEAGIDGVQIGVNGKNFCQLPSEETKNGITLTRNQDGSCTVTGQNGGSATYFDCVSEFDSTLFTGYYLSAGYEGTNATARMRFTQSDYTSILNIGTNERQITDNGRKTKIAIRVAANYQIPEEGITFFPLLRSPDSDGVFAPYSGNVTKIDFPATAHSGTLTVNADGTGTLVADGSTSSISPGAVLSIIGQNNVWTDTNGENTVTYIK